jgi:hypothetical protein
VVVLIFVGPIINTLCTEEITAAQAFFRFTDNISADGTVKHVTIEAWESLFIVAEISHFVELY